MSGWAFYNAVRAWVASQQQEQVTAHDLIGGEQDDDGQWRSDMLAGDPPDAKR